jgi:hypothetical protein
MKPGQKRPLPNSSARGHPDLRLAFPAARNARYPFRNSAGSTYTIAEDAYGNGLKNPNKPGTESLRIVAYC